MSSTIDIQQVKHGVEFRVRVTPRAKQTKLDGIHSGAIRIRLNAPPVDGAANKALAAFLAKHIGCRKGDIELTSGERSRDKTVLIRGADLENVRRVLTDPDV